MCLKLRTLSYSQPVLFQSCIIVSRPLVKEVVQLEMNNPDVPTKDKAKKKKLKTIYKIIKFQNVFIFEYGQVK